MIKTPRSPQALGIKLLQDFPLLTLTNSPGCLSPQFLAKSLRYGVKITVVNTIIIIWF